MPFFALTYNQLIENLCMIGATTAVGAYSLPARPNSRQNVLLATARLTQQIGLVTAKPDVPHSALFPFSGQLVPQSSRLVRFRFHFDARSEAHMLTQLLNRSYFV